jgi:hypothetical protein
VGRYAIVLSSNSTLETLAEVGDNPTISLSAVTA